ARDLPSVLPDSSAIPPSKQQPTTATSSQLSEVKMGEAATLAYPTIEDPMCAHLSAVRCCLPFCSCPPPSLRISDGRTP
ncbi:hypothetical protein CYMTET_33895, partial [Cymbomonas tetramitiformis]